MVRSHLPASYASYIGDARMTTHTKYPLRCQCGHKGYLRMAENDQPFSKQYEKYSLELFDGAEYYIEGFTTAAEALSHMNVSCPCCSRSISGKNIETKT